MQFQDEEQAYWFAWWNFVKGQRISGMSIGDINHLTVWTDFDKYGVPEDYQLRLMDMIEKTDAVYLEFVEKRKEKNRPSPTPQQDGSNTIGRT